MRHIAMLAVITVLAACASQPSPNPQGSVPEARTAAQTQSVVDKGVAKVADATQGEPAKAPPGYKLARRNGELLYCQTVAQVGSNLPKQVCVTPEAYEDMERRMEQDRQNFRKNSTLCGTGGCGGG